MKRISGHILLAVLMGQLSVSIAAERSATGHGITWQSQTFTLSNSVSIEREGELVCIDDESVANQASVLVKLGDSVIPHQRLDCNYDGEADEVAVLIDFAPEQPRQLSVVWQDGVEIAPAMRLPLAAAELDVRVGGHIREGRLHGGEYVNVARYTLPASHFVGDHLFKYEGIGWESQSVAYRLYFDHRGAIDIFGKVEEGLVLDHVGLDGSNYHEMADWGMDVLKVGESLGMGALGWRDGPDNNTQRFSQFDSLEAQVGSGPLVAEVQLDYSDLVLGKQQQDATITYRIQGSSNLTRVHGRFGQAMDGLVTGLVDHKVTRFNRIPTGKEWGYLATYGEQSLAGDTLGMAIFFRQSALSELRQDAHNQLVEFHNQLTEVDYYFAANWSGHVNGTHTQQAFLRYLELQLARLNNPITVTQS